MSDEPKKRSGLARLTDDFDEVELREPDMVTILKLVWHAIRSFFKERPGQIIGSAFILLMVWGHHGKLELLRFVWPSWRGPGAKLPDRPSLLAGIPWDHELISFWGGALLVVVIPVLLIKFGFRQSLAEYGLGLPPSGRRSLAVWTFVTLTA